MINDVQIKNNTLWLMLLLLAEVQITNIGPSGLKQKIPALLQ
jgi:hypothetical protein